jgi:hypothetical protein
MGCFIAPLLLVLGLTGVQYGLHVPEKYRLKLLNIMLWGGVVMLAVEHVAHGEVVPYPPFLTAGLSAVLPEIVSVGVPMTLVIVAVWAAFVIALNHIESSKAKASSE